MYQRSNVTKVLTIVGLALMAAIAAWQFYVFASFTDAKGAIDVQGGTLHLGLAIGIAVLVCVGGFFFFSRDLRYDSRNEMHINSPGQRPGSTGSGKDLP